MNRLQRPCLDPGTLHGGYPVRIVGRDRHPAYHVRRKGRRRIVNRDLVVQAELFKLADDRWPNLGPYAERRFFDFFGTDEMLSELTKPRMEQWKLYLRKEGGLAESTTAGTIQKAKAVFNYAVRVGWVTESPLDGVGRGSFINRENDRFVTMDEYRSLLDVCPCSDWRVIIALARIGGLRCPSEVLRLR